ncbi:hypothetical protein ACFO1B_48835 [Dactylosporangium siamense]|uniref:PBP domain-containing protein n=1 Tax=Dactylosporangium siamense TaxID=685454 RepID=A0A919PXK8_9ACTN|nr:hypothetical protein [Dactylosporangium siamense]GIG52159.1 hypothetical protein Dsi01nite_102000 [Dactylosporangium siamense]
MNLHLWITHGTRGAQGMSWRRRATAGVVAGLVATLLAEVGYIAVAGAADDPSIGKVEYTGTPMTDSAVTLSGDSAFPALKVTVAQTKGLTNQAVTVSWKGMPPGDPTLPFKANYLQVMQCWGDDTSAPAATPAPARETCQYGAYNNNYPDNDPGGLGGVNYVRSRTVLRGDAQERTALGKDGKPLGYDRNVNSSLGGSVPFFPVASNWPNVAAGNKGVLAPFNQPIDQAGGGVYGFADTNELTYNLTRVDGSGEATIEMQTLLESPSLGCGAPVSTASDAPGRACWLVVVPRGVKDDGYRTGAEVGDGFISHVTSSPLSLSNWQHRIAFRLDFRPVREDCALGTAQRRIIGSELARVAFTNWAPTLCSSGRVPYVLNTMPESTARSSITSEIPTSSRAALVNRPLVRDPDHPIAYAPVALSGVVFGFHIERTVATGSTPQAELDTNGSRLPRMNLTPRLAAKLLTESYQRAIPPPDPADVETMPAYLAANPRNLFADPEFLAVNPEAKWLTSPGYEPEGASALVSLENSDATAAVWTWLNADKEARDFLDGKPDPWGAVVNPAYRNLTLPLETFPKSDPTCTALTAEQQQNNAVPLCVVDRAPYMENLEDAARNTLNGRPGGIGGRWMKADDLENRDPLTGLPTVARWQKNKPQPALRRFVISVTSTAEAARFGLQTAGLRNAAGNFVVPTESSLQAGAQAMTGSTDDSRFKVLNPAAKTANAYPLSMVTYAAVAVKDIDTTADPTARTQIADFVDFVSGAGQTRGLAFGQLPPGYAPLPVEMRAAARNASKEIRSGAVAGYTQAPDDDDTTTAPATTAAATTAAAVPDRGSVPSAGPSAQRSSRGPEPVAVVQSGRTPDDPGVLPPWVLLVGLAAGLLSAVAAPFVRPRRRSIDP